MAPEQARGKSVDRRSDIWAFGAVLFEMVTGARAFEGEDIADTLGNVMKVEPDWTQLPASLSPIVAVYVKRCLHKDPKQRVGDIRDVRLALEGAFETAAPQAATPIAAPQPVWRRVLPPAAAVGVGVLLTVAAGGSLWPTAAPLVNRFSYRVPDGRSLRPNVRQVIAISPDGRRFVYNATGGLYVRGLDELEAHVIPGAEAVFSSPVFSPDGQSVAYWQGQEGQLRRVAISGGAPVVIGPVPENPTGVFWGADGTIWFGQLAGIHKVPATGGTPAVVVPAQRGEQLGVSQLLPDGDTVLFTLLSQAGSSVVAQKISTGERTVLVEDGFAPRYLATGHLVYLVDNVLMGVAFDARRMAVMGGAVPVARNVAHVPSRRSLRPFYGYDVSPDGTLVHVYSPGADNISQVGLSDRTGTVTPLTLPAGTYDTVRVSPDGTRIAVGVADPKQAYVAIWDLDGRTALRRLTFGGNHRYPIWSRDGQRVTYQSDREGDWALYWQRADGTGPAERLTRPEKGREHLPASWSPNDDSLLFTNVPSSTTTFAGALWTYERRRGVTAPFAGVSGVAQSPMFSPDGRWVAYASRDQGGPFGIYVQPSPATGTRYQLPNLKGSAQSILPLWSPDGTALYFAPSVGQLAVTAVTTRPTFGFGISIEVPRRFTGTVDGGAVSVRSFDLMPDGRFIGLDTPGPLSAAAGTASRQPEIHIVLNWFEELKRLVPVK
jgi:serine/threonine-protein kinase